MEKILEAVDAQHPIQVFPDGDQWCALFGDDIQSGQAVFANTPEEAIADLIAEMMSTSED